MNYSIFSLFFLAVLWNFSRSVLLFHRISKCQELNQYFTLKKLTPLSSKITLVSSWWIILSLIFWKGLQDSEMAVLQILVLVYTLVITYRFCKVFLSVTGVHQEEKDEELAQELEIMDQVVDVKRALMVEPAVTASLELLILISCTFQFVAERL